MSCGFNHATFDNVYLSGRVCNQNNREVLHIAKLRRGSFLVGKGNILRLILITLPNQSTDDREKVLSTQLIKAKYGNLNLKDKVCTLMSKHRNHKSLRSQFFEGHYRFNGTLQLPSLTRPLSACRRFLETAFKAAAKGINRCLSVFLPPSLPSYAAVMTFPRTTMQTDMAWRRRRRRRWRMQKTLQGQKKAYPPR